MASLNTRVFFSLSRAALFFPLLVGKMCAKSTERKVVEAG